MGDSPMSNPARSARKPKPVATPSRPSALCALPISQTALAMTTARIRNCQSQ
jgi:hypothetical protein